ncbi:hypothetical protein [Ralstonia sp. ASV6]|jgi:hypothetical protein|uniref:hypothetical protein n=1 Tax=Ralstonia sp. ASV6 TaxID=2795124 RepID=UPI001E5569A3|nr:hypothetical protein [Ralstonia sp. ASV6]
MTDKAELQTSLPDRPDGDAAIPEQGRALSYSSIRIWGRTQTALAALIVLLVVAVVLFAIPRVILPWTQSAFAQRLDPAVWADYTGPYDVAAAVVAVSAIVIYLTRR